MEWVQHYVSLAGDVGESLAEMYDEHEFDAALARLDELGTAPSSDPRHPRAENSAMALADRLVELYAAGQMDRVRALLADDAVLIDKRPIIGMEVAGGDAIVASLSAAVDIGFVAARTERLAVRGSTLALGRVTTDVGGFESQYLNIGQLDADGLISHIVLFDEDALAEALAELDARYFAGEGARVGTAARSRPPIFRGHECS